MHRAAKDYDDVNMRRFLFFLIFDYNNKTIDTKNFIKIHLFIRRRVSLEAMQLLERTKTITLISILITALL